MTRPEGSPEALEMRRRLAVRLLEYGLDGREVAEAFDVSPGSVSRWKRAYEREGMAGLEADPHPGRDPILDDGQLLELASVLREGPRAYGFEADDWTRERVATVVEREFGESVSEATAYRYLRRMGWDCGGGDGESAEAWRQRQWERARKRLGAGGEDG